MSSIIEGYNYDIFISYRQKDNKGDRWVSEFVDALKTELESTFKEEISVYFDINPHDGLLETHDVASLKDKLKCLVFVPIISRTYCDPKSFAWEHEFKAFVELASYDQFGSKVKLPNGNVANRVFPVRIHELDIADIKECESVLGGVLRSVDFIYKSAGVNRPLRSKEEKPQDNLNNTLYRDQINKVANSIKEIISGLKKEPLESVSDRKEVSFIEDKPLIKEKSIIVLPFENISPDADQEYFSDGLTEEIITDLSHINDLLVISRSSAMTFKGTKKTIPEIAQTVNVRYVLEGSVRKERNNLRITAQLIDALTDTHIWAEKYSGTLDNVFDIQEKVSQSIVNALKLKLSFQEEERITIKPIRNIQLHECYLKAKYEIYIWTKESLDRAVHILETGLENYGENALLYATLGEAKYLYYDIGAETSKNILNEVEEYAKKALALEPDIAQGYKLYSLLEMGRGSLIQGYKYIKGALKADPNDPGIIMHTAGFMIYLGNPSFAEPLYKKLLDIDPLSAMNYLFVGLGQYFQGYFENAVGLVRKSLQIDPEFVYSIFWHPVFLAANNQKHEALELIDQIIKEGRMSEVFKELILFIKYVLMGRKTQALNTLSDETKKYTWNDPLFSGLMPGYFSLINEKEKVLDYLNHALDRGFINYPFFSKIDPFLENIRGEERFKKLMERVKYEWENFEV
jgi:TolB-like protein